MSARRKLPGAKCPTCGGSMIWDGGDSTRCADHGSARAREAGLRKALADAIELAEEGWGYASPYFREKWGVTARVQRLQDALRERP